MDIDLINVKMEEVFLELGFSPIIINGTKYMRFKNCYCKMTYLKPLGAFVIECANNLYDVEKGMLEDCELYYTDMSETELLDKLRSNLIKYYMN